MSSRTLWQADFFTYWQGIVGKINVDLTRDLTIDFLHEMQRGSVASPLGENRFSPSGISLIVQDPVHVRCLPWVFALIPFAGSKPTFEAAHHASGNAARIPLH